VSPKATDFGSIKALVRVPGSKSQPGQTDQATVRGWVDHRRSTDIEHRWNQKHR
jgi:hypothetical protein